jgi:hypothetical protein
MSWLLGLFWVHYYMHAVHFLKILKVNKGWARCHPMTSIWKVLDLIPDTGGKKNSIQQICSFAKMFVLCNELRLLLPPNIFTLGKRRDGNVWNFVYCSMWWQGGRLAKMAKLEHELRLENFISSTTNWQEINILGY